MKVPAVHEPDVPETPWLSHVAKPREGLALGMLQSLVETSRRPQLLIDASARMLAASPSGLDALHRGDGAAAAEGEGRGFAQT